MENGFLVCTFEDGDQWESEKPNITFKDFLDDDDDKTTKKKPTKKTPRAANKKPAAPLAEPAAPSPKAK